MGGFAIPTDGSASLVLGLAIALVSCLPIWALLLWMAASPRSWRWRAEMSWKRLLVPVAAFAAVIGGGYGWSWVMHSFIGRSRPGDQAVVYWVWIAQLFFAGIAVIIVASVRASSRVGSTAAVHWEWRRTCGAVVVAWGALAVVLVALRAGSLVPEAAPSGHWWAFAVSSAILVALSVLLVYAIVGTLRAGPDATAARR